MTKQLNITISGPAGCGKTQMLALIKDEVKSILGIPNLMKREDSDKRKFLLKDTIIKNETKVVVSVLQKKPHIEDIFNVIAAHERAISRAMRESTYSTAKRAKAEICAQTVKRFEELGIAHLIDWG